MKPVHSSNTSSSAIRQAEDSAIVWLAKLNSPDLTQAEQDAFFAWVEASPLHQAAYIKAEQLWQRGAALEGVREPAAARVRVQSWRTLAVWQGWAVACSCLLVVGLMWFALAPNQDRASIYQTAIGEQQTLELEDGSVLILNTNSQIKVHYSARARSVNLLQGEVFFDVAKDTQRPFDIETRFGVVRVLGTRFAVYESPTDAVVTVVNGRVALGNAAETGGEFVPSAVLQADQRLSLRSAQAGQAAESLDANASLAWRKRQLIVNDQPLHELITELNRYFPERIALADAGLGERKVTAVIQLGDIHTTLQTVAQSLDLQAEFSSDGSAVTLLAASRDPASTQ